MRVKHLREIGTDPRTGQFRQGEADCAQRLQRARVNGKQVGMLIRDPTGDVDWIDANGKTYDAVGPAPPSYFDARQFNHSINAHLLKQGLDHVVVDLTGLRKEQAAAVKAHVADLPADLRHKIVILGN